MNEIACKSERDRLTCDRSHKCSALERREQSGLIRYARRDDNGSEKRRVRARDSVSTIFSPGFCGLVR